MKQAIQFGAGNIGRSFMGAILERTGWHFTFADVVEPIVDAINAQKHYTVHILDHECYDWEITNISAVNSAGPDIAPAIAQCDLITTAVGPLVLPKIAVTIAQGIQAGIAAGNRSPMNVICCENGLHIIMTPICWCAGSLSSWAFEFRRSTMSSSLDLMNISATAFCICAVLPIKPSSCTTTRNPAKVCLSIIVIAMPPGRRARTRITTA